MFHVGQHVVCVKRGEWRLAAKRGETNPTYGQVLTVREIEREFGQTWLRFDEIRNLPIRCGGTAELRYCSTRFRPLQDSRLDIFRQLLVNPPEQGVDA